jgi:formylglycine-generating enzyme required for sulfatase activity
MLGNVLEWCSDWYGRYPPGRQENPAGPARGEWKVVRGGSWNDIPVLVRVSFRYRLDPEYRNDMLGFRCAGE